MNRSRWLIAVVSVVFAAVVASVLLGLSYPDGLIGQDDPDDSSPTAQPSATNSPQPTSDRAPELVAGVWPGRPDSTPVVDGEVDWCPAVKVKASAAARALAESDLDEVACHAVRYMLDGRLTRLAIPQRNYSLEDFDHLEPFFHPTSYERGLVPLLTRFVKDPEGYDISRQLSIFLGRGTPENADHARAVERRVFYGPAFTKKGYKGRAVWINPTWSKVRITAAGALLDVELSASAALPVYNPAAERDDMMVVESTLQLRYLATESGEWLITAASGQFSDPKLERLNVAGG